MAAYYIARSWLMTFVGIHFSQNPNVPQLKQKSGAKGLMTCLIGAEKI